MVAVKLHGRDVHALVRQHAGHFADVAGLIDVLHNQRRQIAGEVGAQAVHLHHHDAPAAQRRAGHRERFAAWADQVDARGVRVFAARAGERERKRHARFAGQIKASGDALVVRLKAQQPGNQRAIRAVAAAGCGKRAEQRNRGLARRALAQQPARRAPQPNRARRVRAARPDHHRAENIKQIHLCPPSFALYGL